MYIYICVNIEHEMGTSRHWEYGCRSVTAERGGLAEESNSVNRESSGTGRSTMGNVMGKQSGLVPQQGDIPLVPPFQHPSRPKTHPSLIHRTRVIRGSDRNDFTSSCPQLGS